MIVTAGIGITPPEGVAQALIPNNPGGVPPASIAAFAGIPLSFLQNLSMTGGPGAGPLFNGSALQQTFTAQAGDVVTFDWKFLTNEFPGETFFRDFSFVAFVGPTQSNALLLANTLSPGFVSAPAASGFTFMTPAGTTGSDFNHFAFTLPQTGTWTMTLGTLNVGDNLVNSALLVDNVQVGGSVSA
jgi:hypothetical protein